MEFLKGRFVNASALLKKALKRAKGFSFGIEIKHANRLIKALKTGKGFPFNLP